MLLFLEFSFHLDLFLGLIDLGDSLEKLTEIKLQHLRFSLNLALG